MKVQATCGHCLLEGNIRKKVIEIKARICSECGQPVKYAMVYWINYDCGLTTTYVFHKKCFEKVKPKWCAPK